MGKVFRKVHIDLSLFFLPLALLYAISGALYLSGFNQNSGAKVWHFSLPIAEKNQIPDLINQWLTQNHLEVIKDMKLRKGKNSSWTMGEAAYSADIQNRGEMIEVKVIKRSFWGNLIMLHKGKAKWYFDVLAFGFAFSLLMFYFSGLVMTNFCNKRRKRALMVVGLGFVVTFVVGYLSL